MNVDDVPPSGGGHQLPILGQDAPDPWGLPELPPTTLLGFFEHRVPTADQVRESLLKALGGAIRFHGEPPDQPEQSLWAMVVEIEGHEMPMVIWTEQVYQEVMELPACAGSSQGLLGVQSMLDTDDPLATWERMVRVVGDAVGDVAALVDIETEQWFSGEELATRLLGSEATSEETMLFRIHVASSVEEPGESDPVWLRTLGLHRCGRPEFEMLEVDGAVLPLAHDLLEAVAALCIQRGTPDPGFPFEAGVNVALSLRTLSEQLELLSPKAVGTRTHRESTGGTRADGNPMLHGRAVVCGAEPRGSFREIFTWPVDAIERLARGEGGLERTERWTRSTSFEARRLWPRLLEGFRDGRSAQACIALPVDEGGREQVWIQVDDASDSELRGTLISRPAQIDILPGDPLVATLDDLIDWRLLEHPNERT